VTFEKPNKALIFTEYSVFTLTVVIIRVLDAQCVAQDDLLYVGCWAGQAMRTPGI